MDEVHKFWYYPAMALIPSWQLYGETHAFPDLLHIEKIIDRAAGLDWVIAPHRHLNLHQVFLLRSGTIRLTLDGQIQDILPAMVINIPRGCVHGFEFSAGTEGFVLTLPAGEFPELFDVGSETAEPLNQAFTIPAGELQNRFDEIAADHAAGQPFRLTCLRAGAAALIATMLRQAPQGRAHAPRDIRIKRFEAKVLASLHLRLSIDDYARALSISPRTLGRLCKTETGLSAQALVETFKMREACRLLVYTRLSAQQVAYQLGFDDPSHFGRVFQRNLRRSPRAYRKSFES
jgi:AraC family transcriptional regulator, transcriptional activator of pobA